MKKVFIAILMLALFVSSSSASVIGTLNRANLDTQEAEAVEFRASDAFTKSMLGSVIDARLDIDNATIRFYNSLMTMQLALSKGEIDAVASPEYVGEYMLRQNSGYELRGFIIGKSPIAMAFGFLDENKELCDKFSRAVEDMEREGVIGILGRDFITGPSAQNPPAVEFAKFDDAETLTVALTGDMPPLDYVGADGEPAGFNTAILAEIGRRLHVNIKPLNVETGARAAALKSGRADVVFWFMVFMGYDAKQEDIPEGIITSTPYFGWNKSVLIGRK